MIPLSRRLLLAATILACSAAAAAAQQGLPHNSVPREIRGQVRYAEGGAPADNVIVRLESSSGGLIEEVYTDRTGRFRFGSLSPGDYTVRVHKAGFVDVERRIDLQRVSSDMVFAQLAPDRSARATTTTAAPSVISVIDASVPEPARLEFERGRDAVMTGRVKEGLPMLQKAAQLHPNFFEALLLLGTSHMELGQWGEAERSLQSARSANPKAAQPLFALGEVFRRQKKYADAERVLVEGLKLDEKSPQGHLSLGRVYWEQNDLTKAGPSVGRALKLKPDYAEAHLLAGNILLRARRPENALVEFEEYLRLAPQGEFAAQARSASDRIKKALADQKKD